MKSKRVGKPWFFVVLALILAGTCFFQWRQYRKQLDLRRQGLLYFSEEDYAKAMELDLRVTAYCLPPSRREECSACDGFRRLSAEEAGALLVEDILLREGPEGIRHRAEHLSEPPQADCDLMVGDTISCMAGRSQFWMSWNGVMSPCGMFTNPHSLPLEQGFDAVAVGTDAAILIQAFRRMKTEIWKK